MNLSCSRRITTSCLVYGGRCTKNHSGVNNPKGKLQWHNRTYIVTKAFLNLNHVPYNFRNASCYKFENYHYIPIFHIRYNYLVITLQRRPSGDHSVDTNVWYYSDASTDNKRKKLKTLQHSNVKHTLFHCSPSVLHCPSTCDSLSCHLLKTTVLLPLLNAPKNGYIRD